MTDAVLRISATEFKATCLSVFRALESRKYTRVVVTRRGKPIAELTPPQDAPPELWGALRGSVKVPSNVDLTAPTADEALDAEVGTFHR